MSKKNCGILKISMSLLEHWMQLPPGTRILSVAPDGVDFSVILEGQALPETEGNEIPFVLATITTTAPKWTFELDEATGERLPTKAEDAA